MWSLTAIELESETIIYSWFAIDHFISKECIQKLFSDYCSLENNNNTNHSYYFTIYLWYLLGKLWFAIFQPTHYRFLWLELIFSIRTLRAHSMMQNWHFWRFFIVPTSFWGAELNTATRSSLFNRSADIFNKSFEKWHFFIFDKVRLSIIDFYDFPSIFRKI